MSARRRARAAPALALTALLATAPGCGGTPEPTPGAPLEPRATWVLEPPRVRIGEVATIELVVATEPGFRVLPLRPPAPLPGFWVLEALGPEVTREPERWLHRTRVRLRARELGVHVWPAQELEIEPPAGERQRLALPERELEVVSVMPELPDRLEPFGLLAPPEAARGGSLRGQLAAAAAGAAGTLLALALVVLARRRRARRRGRSDAVPLAPPDWTLAERALGAALERVESDPRGAADLGAGALRHYVASRFQAGAAAWTLEEFEAAPAPRAARAFWPELLERLRTLEEFRFRPAAWAAPAPSLREALEGARSLVQRARSGDPS